jgi:hypothetical protein
MSNMLRFELNYGMTITPDDMEPGHLYLDGACQGPAVDFTKPAISFDHHAGCVRSFTLATCQQVDTALRLGLDVSAYHTVVMNDLDADTVVAAWLLESAVRATGRDFLADPRIIDLVARVGFVDSHGPIVPSHPMHRALSLPPDKAQVYEDYVRLSDRLQEWYDTGVVPASREFPPAPWFGVRTDGSVVSGEGDFATAYEAGAVAAVALVPGPAGTVRYTVGKRSEFVPFSVSAFLHRMNELEPGWGGGSTIGGAPRNTDGSRSRLDQGVVRAVFLDVAGVR